MITWNNDLYFMPGLSVRYLSGPWSQRAGATREWVLGVTEETVPVQGQVGAGQVLPNSLLSVAGLDVALTPEKLATLAREELASFSSWGIRFEAMLEAGFAAQIATATDVTAPRLTFMLHEMTDETRHQRVFQELVKQLRPRARSPYCFRGVSACARQAIRSLVGRPAMLFVLVLFGEELVEGLQQRAVDHPATDPFVRDVYRFHLAEEADHVSFARAVYSEVWVQSSWLDRAMVRWLAPSVLVCLVDSMVHPWVYREAGLPALATWRAVRRTAARTEFRRQFSRPVVEALLESGAFRAGRVPRSWQRLSGVDRHGGKVSEIQGGKKDDG